MLSRKVSSGIASPGSIDEVTALRRRHHAEAGSDFRCTRDSPICASQYDISTWCDFSMTFWFAQAKVAFTVTEQRDPVSKGDTDVAERQRTGGASPANGHSRAQSSDEVPDVGHHSIR